LSFAPANILQALVDFVTAEKARPKHLESGSEAQQSSAPQQPRVFRAFLQAQAQLPKLKPAASAPSSNETKVLHLKNIHADQGLEDYLSGKIDEMQLTASSLQEELLQQQQLVLDSQSRAQRLEEALQQTTLEYERHLQQYADEMAQLKLDHDQQLQQASQAFAQQVEATQRSLRLMNESDRAIQAESWQLEQLRQRLEEDQKRLEEEQGKFQALRIAVQIQESTAETALSSVVNQQATMHAQQTQLNADRNADNIRWQLQQVIGSVAREILHFHRIFS
jgi:DNA repair exonuclease SbcCD ATPase subunit